MSTLAIIQARMGSTRFPGKVLQPIGGKAILLHIIERLSAVPSIEEIVVAIPEGHVDQRPRACNPVPVEEQAEISMREALCRGALSIVSIDGGSPLGSGFGAPDL